MSPLYVVRVKHRDGRWRYLRLIHHYWASTEWSMIVNRSKADRFPLAVAEVLSNELWRAHWRSEDWEFRETSPVKITRSAK